MKKMLMFLLFALPALGDLSSNPVVRLNPAYPRDGQFVTIGWRQSFAGSGSFGTPSVQVLPVPFYGGLTYGAPHTVTIRQTANIGGDVFSTDQESVFAGPVEAGTYEVTLEVSITTSAGPTTETFPMATFVVPPACSSVASATATYSWEKSGYELDFEDFTHANVFTGPPVLVSIDGNHVTVRQTLTYAGIPSTRPSCIFGGVDLGAISPGTYRLTWIYDEFFAPASVLAIGSTLTRELTFEARLPRRRTTR
jgi:hypothetical protein